MVYTYMAQSKALVYYMHNGNEEQAGRNNKVVQNMHNAKTSLSIEIHADGCFWA